MRAGWRRRAPKLLWLQDYAERRALRGELRLLAKEERSRQQKAVGECLARAKVVCATLTGCLSHDLEPLAFDLAIVDEAAQALPPLQRSSPS